jgi:glycerol-3-phosphate dehydrogenase
MYDCIIIGSGISGATIARELSKFNLKSIILEKDFDVATEATMANSAIVHSGHDPIPGSLKAKYNVLGNRMYKKMSDELDIPFMECGGMVVAIDDEQMETVNELYDRALLNGLLPSEIKKITREEALELEPSLSDLVLGGLHLPTTAVTFPWEGAIANIENAMDNGVELSLETKVTNITKDEFFKVETTKGLFEGRVVINAAGMYASKVAEMLYEPEFNIRPRRGEYLVIDSDTKVVDSVIYPTPTSKGKGVILTPQTHGETLVGPTSEFVSFENAMKTTSAGVTYVKEHAVKSVKNIPFHKVIRSFAGARPTGDTGDFIIGESKVEGFINVAGIESPGLTAAPAIAVDIAEIVKGILNPTVNEEFNPKRRKVIRLSELNNNEISELIKKDKAFANIICRCENITEGEIVDSIHRNCGSHSVVGVKARVRPGAGRCQGGFCQPEVLKILARELNKDPMDVEYKGTGSNILVAKTKDVE